MLTVFAPDNRGGLPKDGVRHITDPEFGEHPSQEGGCWDFTEDQKILAKVNSWSVETAMKLAETQLELEQLKKQLLG